MVELRCPVCNSLLNKFEPAEGFATEGYCPQHRLEITVRQRPKRASSGAHFFAPLDNKRVPVL